MLDKYIPYGEYEGGDVNFFIANTYNVPGIGIVLSGIMKSGSVKKGDVLYLGPNANGYLRDVNTNTIISIYLEKCNNCFAIIYLHYI